MTDVTEADSAVLAQMGEIAFEARMKAKRDPLWLGHNILGFDFAQPADFHVEAAKAIVRREDFILMAPRGHGKTTLCNEVGLVFEILRDPNIRILLAHGVLDKAKLIMSGAMGQFRMNKRLRALFPELVPQTQAEDPTKTQYVCPGRTKPFREPTVMVAAPGSTVTGLHFDVIQATDLVNEQNVPGPIGKGSYEMMDQVWEFMRNFEPLLEATNEHSREQHNCTRWFDGDAYGRMVEEYPHMRAISSGIDLDENGEPVPIWSLVSKERLIKAKTRAGPWLWAANYCQGPLSAETQIFRPEFFHVYEELPEELSVAVTVDMAHEGEGEGSDEAALIASGTCPKGHLYVMSASKGRWSLAETLRRVVALAQSSGAQWVGFETGAYKKTVKHMLEMEMLRSGLHVPVRLLKSHSQNKVTRAGPLAFFAEMYGIHIKPEMQGDFMRSFLSFPASRDDHYVDALAYRAQDIRPAFAARTEALERRGVLDLSAWQTKGSDLIAKMGRDRFRGLRIA